MFVFPIFYTSLWLFFPKNGFHFNAFLKERLPGAEKALVLPIGDSHPNASNPNPNLAVFK